MRSPIYREKIHGMTKQYVRGICNQTLAAADTDSCFEKTSLATEWPSRLSAMAADWSL